MTVVDIFAARETRRQPVSVLSLDDAYAAYWTARNFREDQAAYHEILLHDGYPGCSRWRIWAARTRALWVERK